MGAVAHDFNLTVDPEAVSDILEDILYFLDGVLLLVLRIVNRNDNSITSLTYPSKPFSMCTNALDKLVFSANMELNTSMGGNCMTIAPTLGSRIWIVRLFRIFAHRSNCGRRF